MGKESKQRIKYLAFGILGMISLIAGVSFAVFSASISGREVQTINTGCLKVEMTDNGQLNLTNAYPVTDSEGLTSDPYVYTITNTCTVDAYYEATLNVMDGSNLSNLSKIKVALNGDSYLKPTVENSLDNGTLLEANNDVLRTYVLDEGYLKAGESKTFNLRTWIDYSVTSITGQVENKVIIQSEARNGNTIVYNTNSIGYFSGNRETLLRGVSYKTVATESGIVESKSGNSTSYYFRGNPTNTVAFGTYNSSFNGHQEGDSIRWKILSTNSDGSVNLITEEAIGQSSYTNAVNLLNSFYNTHLSDEESYIKTDSTFCREKASNGSYLAKIRTENNNPTSGCNGNEVYTKIGLPTVDELMFAGAVLDTQNTNFYLYNGGSFLTGSASSASTVYASNASKSIYEVSGSTELGIRPVITVKKDTTLSGAGTSASPYYVTGKYTDESTSSSDTTNPVIVYARVDEKWSNVNKPIEISAEDDAIAGYIVKTTNTTPSANDNGWEVATSKKYTTISTYDNGTYYVFAKDKAGNISAAEQVVIERVDKVAPTCSIRLNSTPDSSVNKTLTVISQDTNIDLKGYTWDDDNSITTSTRKINQNGVYKAYLKDLAGNQGTCQITVTSVTEFYTIIYKANNGVGEDKEEQVAIGVEHKLLKNTYTRVGYGFIGWDTNSSATTATYQDKEEVTNLTTSGNTITLYAIWDANALTFDGDEITKTFNTSGQTVTITGASNGSGTYTYTEKSETSSGQSTNHISISGTTITIGANTPAGTYTYVVTARDTVTGREKDATFTITVNKKALTVEATCNNKTYDGNTTAACSITNTENANVTINGTCTFDNKNAGTSKTVTCSSLTISGTNSSSYSVPSSTTTRANITAKALTIKADNKTRPYASSTTQTYSYTATGFVTGESASNLTGSISYAVKDGNTPVTVNASLAAGTYTIVPSGFTSANYDITYQNGTLTVEGIDAVCPELTGYSGTYDGQSHTITTSGHSGGTLEYRTSATEGEWTTTKPTRTIAGETTVYVRVKGDSNHNTVTCDSETIEIAKREITVTATTQEKTYDGTALNANTACSVTTGTLISGHTVTCAASGSQTNAGTSTKTLGTVVINDSNSNAVTSNYQITKANGSLKVNMKPLTITVDDKERNYGSSAAQTYSYTATGFVNGEDESVFTGTATYKVKKNGTQVTVDENLAAGSYVIQLTGLYASNYNIEIENGTLTVNKINATCPSLTSYSGTYDGNAHSITVGNNAVGGTVKYRTTTNGTWSATKPEITNVADSPKTVYVEVEGDTNHNTVNCYVSGTTSATITLAKKTVTVKAENKEMTYGGNAPSYTYTISGVVTGDTAVTGSASYQVTDNGNVVSNVSQADAGTYTITPSGLTANNNYTISYQTGTLTINRSRVATTGSCINNLVYDGEEKTLASGATHASYTNNTGTSAQNENAYTVTVNAATNYAFSDGTTSKTLSCVIHRANGYVTVDNNKSVEFGTTSTTFNVLTDHGGTLSVTDDNATATSSISGKVVTIGSIGSLTAGTEVEVTVTVAQTANYKSASKVFTLTIGNKKDATTGSCASNLVYNTTSQSLASGGANVTYVNNQGTNASDNYTVTVNANTNHAFSDGSTSKTLTCSIAKATPVLTITPASGTTIVGSTVTFNEKSSVAGKFTNTSSNTSKATVSPATNSSPVAANTNSSVTVTGAGVGEATITVTFTPTDTTNYNSITATSEGKKEYTVTVASTAAIPTTSYCKSLTYNGDDQTLVNAAGTGFTWDSTTISGKNATSYTVKANVSNGYRWSDNSTSEKSITCSISKKGITVKAEDKEMIYGGSAPTYTYQVTGVISGETGVTGTASYAVKNSGGTTITVGPNTSVGEYTIHVSGLSATSNYQITATNTGTLTVVEDEAVCPSGSNYAGYSGTYDGNSHTITATGEQGGTLEYRTSTTGNWDSAKPSRTNAGTTTVYVRVKGDSNHSDKDCGSKTIVINPKTLTVTATDKSRAYGESNPGFTYTYSGNISGETPAFTGSLTTSATTSSAVGSYDITKGTLALADGTGFIASNYTMSYQKGTLTVTAATPTVNLSAKTEAQRTYTGSAITANSATVTLKNSETYSGTITYKYYTNSTCTTGETTTAPTNVGTYYAQASIAAAGNYTSAKSSCVNHSIVEAEAVCPSGTNYANYSGTYDGESHTITATGHSGGSLQYRTSTSDEWSSTKPTGTNVADSKTVYVRVKGDSNHNDKDCGSKTITISKKTLTVTAANKSRTYGTANPTFTYTSSGAVSGETPAFTGSLTTSATTTSPAGTYDITQGTLALTNGTGFIANNYTMSYTKGTLTVTEKEITVTATNQEKVYDGSALSANTACSVTSGSLETGHTVTCTASGSQGPDIGTSTKTLGTVTIKDGSNNDVTSSYDITKANGTLKVTARPITITAKDQSIVYGSSISTGTGQVTVSTSPYGLVSGHSLNSISLAQSTSNVTTTGKITPSSAVIKDGSNNTVTGNYNITYAQGDLTITQREVTVTAPTMASGTLTYSGSDQTITGSAGSCSAGGTMYYYTANYTTTTAPTFSSTSSNWSTTFPSSAKGNSAGTYHLWYYCYVSDTTNNKAASGSSINTALSVTKAIGKYTPTLAISATTGSVNYNATNSFTATPTTISSCVGNLTATSASASYVTTSTTSGGTYAVSATHSDAASASAKTFYYKGIAYTTGNNVTVSYTPSDTNNCNSAQTKTISIAVNKVDATCPTLTAYSAQYDGSAHGITVGSNASGGTVQYRKSTSENWSNTKPTITNVSESPITTYVQVLGDPNHNTKDCGSSTVTISKRKVTVTAPTANSSTLTYSGSAQNLLATAGSCSAGGTMYWWSSNPSKTQTSAPSFSTSSGWTTTAPTSTSYKGTEAGTYYMWYYCYVSDTANNEATSGSTINTAQSITKAINKADPTITLYTTSSGTTTFNNGASRGAIPYDSNIKSYPMANIAGSWKAASSNTTYVTVSPTSNTSTSANTRREITATGAGYTTSAITVTLTFTPTDTTNYNTATRTYTHTVSKVDATCPTLTSYSGTYDGSAHSITVGSNASGGTVKYRTTTNGTWSATKPSITNVADSPTTVYVEVEGDSNHNTVNCYVSGTTSPTITISKRKVTVTAPTANSSTLTYSGSAQNLLATAGSCSAGGTMYWWSSNPSKTQTTAPTFSTSSGWTTTAPTSTSYKGTEAGTYYIWYYCYVSDTANNEANSGSTINTAQSITKAINKADPTITLYTTSSGTTTFNNGASRGAIPYDSNIKSYPMANIAGSWKAASSNTTYVTVSPTSNTSTSANTRREITATGAGYTTSAITVTLTFTPTDTTNYNTATRTYTHTVDKVDATCPTLTAYSAQYDGSAHGITVGSNASGGTVQYRTSTSGSWSNTKPTITNVADSPITTYVQVAGDSNHNTVDCGSKTVTITKRKVTVTAPTMASGTLTYNGSSQRLMGSAGSCSAGGTMYYYTQLQTSSTAPTFSTSSGSGWSTTFPNSNTQSNAGTYYFWYYCYVSDTANNEAASGSSINTALSVTKTINQLKCSAPTSVAVSTGGYVSWTNSATSACTTHQVKVASGSYATATSPVDKNSDITGSTGSRTVNVIAKAPNNNYSDSDAASASVTVYAITLASNDTNKGTVSPTSKNVISGTTLATSGNNLLIKGKNASNTDVTLATVTPTPATGYSFSSWSKTSGSLTSAQTITATFTGNTYTATFYYQSNTTSGTQTVATTTAQCTVTSGSSCAADIPTAVINSGGKYNNAYAGLNTSYGADMSPDVAKSATTVTLSANSNYYTIYSTGINIYYPSSASAATSKTVYQNQWFTSNTAMATTVISSTATGTSTNATAGDNVSGYSLVGFNTSASQNTANSGTTIAALGESNSGRNATRSVYQVEKKEDSVEATFYYSTASDGTVGSVTASGTRTTYLRPTSTSAAGTSVTEGSISAPTLTGAVVPTGTTAVTGFATSSSSMSATSSYNTGTTKYYKVYRSSITLREPTSTTECLSTSSKYYRNAFINVATPTVGTTKYTKVLATTNTGTSDNASYTSSVSGYDIAGYATSSGTGTPTITYATLTGTTTPVRDGSHTTIYAILSKSVTATFYYSTAADGTVGSTTASGTQYIRCSSATAATVVNGSISPTITGETVPTGTSSKGWASANSDMATASPTTANTKYYKAYSKTVTVYKPTSTSACNSTDTVFYRNAFINVATPTVGTTKYTKVLATANTGITDNASYTPAVSGYSLVGYVTSVGSYVSPITYATLTGSTTPLRDGTDVTVYTVLSTPVDVTFYYSSSNVGAKTSTTVNSADYLRCINTTTASVINGTPTVPSTTAPYGTTFNGWATSANTMTTTTANTANTSYYAVYAKSVTLNYYGTSSYTSKTVYRNGVYGSNTNYTMYLADSTTGVANYTTASGPGSSVWTGLSTANDTTPEYTSVGDYNTGAAYSTNTAFYTVYTFNVNYEVGANVSEVGATTANCKVNAKTTNSGGTSCTVTLPTITPESGYVSVGWNTTNGATTGTAAGASYTINTNPTTLYANALPTVTYNAGNCPTASNLPATQTKTGASLTLSSAIPTCSNGKTFIGWSTSQSATETSTWYNEGGTYTDDAPLTLYAQWYDVASLENWYTTAVQSGDFSAVTENSYTVTRENSTSWNYTATNTTYPPTQSGYVVKGVTGFSVNGDYYRPFGVDQDSIKVRDMRDASTPITPSSSIFSKQYMSVKSRTATTYTSDTINARIDRLQKIQDVALTYDDIETRTKVEDNITMTHNKSLSVSLAAANADWQPVALAGHNLANATTNGINTSRTALVKYYKSNAQSTPGNADNATIMLDYYANPDNTPKVKLTIYYIVAKNKTARSTTFNGTTLTTQGASRYAALVALDSDRGDYFPESYVKRYTRIEGTAGNVSAWGTGTAAKNISIPDGKILGVFGHGVTTGTNGEGSSYSIINKNYVTGINTTSGTYNMIWYAGNVDGPDQDGHAQTQVFGWGHAFYISSGTMTVTDSNQFTVSYGGGDGCPTATGLPSSQTKINGTNLTLQSGTPTCSDGKIFLGWATSMSASDTEGTWYDPGSTYTANAALSLYAQWADIDSLEESYTTYVQADDFHQERASNTQTITAGNAKTIDFTVPTVSGYTKKMRSGFSESVIYRPYYFSSTNRGIYRNMASGSATAYDYYLYLRDRTAATYSSDSIDTRIDRLLKLQDVVLSYSDIKGVKQTINPVSITTSAVGKGFYPDSGWKFISASGFEINTNDVSGGQNVTNTYVLANYVADDGSSGTLSVAPSISNANAKVSYWANFTEVNNSKTARTTTFAPTSGKGLARYNALEALKADKSNHFPASYFKTTRVNVGRITKSAWGEWNSWKDVSIPNGKVLGIVGFAASNDTSNNGSGESYAAVTDVWPGSSLLNNTSGQLFNTVYAANSQRSVSTGNAMSNVNFYNDVLYVSSGTLTGGTVTWE